MESDITRSRANRFAVMVVWCITIALVAVALVVLAHCIITGQSCDEEAPIAQHRL